MSIEAVPTRNSAAPQPSAAAAHSMKRMGLGILEGFAAGGSEAIGVALADGSCMRPMKFLDLPTVNPVCGGRRVVQCEC